MDAPLENVNACTYRNAKLADIRLWNETRTTHCVQDGEFSLRPELYCSSSSSPMGISSS
jgi:hypothetical protein